MGSALEAEKEDVSKSTTCWYWPWWKALWMLTSSGLPHDCKRVRDRPVERGGGVSHLLLRSRDPSCAVVRGCGRGVREVYGGGARWGFRGINRGAAASGRTRGIVKKVLRQQLPGCWGCGCRNGC